MCQRDSVTASVLIKRTYHVTLLNIAIVRVTVMIRTCSSVVKHFPSGFLLRRIHRSSAINNQMSAQQPAWSLPKRQSEEPILKVYNSLTKTKVSLNFCQPSGERSYIIYRQNSSHVTAAISNGITVVPQCTMLHIWGMQGKIIQPGHIIFRYTIH